jgi:hypothetical protein
MKNRSFTRKTRVTWVNIEERLREEPELSDQQREFALRHLDKLVPIKRGPEYPTPLDADWDEFGPEMWEIIMMVMKILAKYWTTPYTVTFENSTPVPLEFVWAPESKSGLVLLEYVIVEPGESKSMTSIIMCLDMWRYAFSVYDMEGYELFTSPTMTVLEVNYVEKDKGTYKACEDILEITAD